MWTIDRIEDGIAILESDDEQRLELLQMLLPEDAKEGDVLREEAGVYFVDIDETNRRREQIRSRFRRLLS